MADSTEGLGPHAGVILAGGKSTRMGVEDKALMPLGGKPMIARVIERLRPQVERIVINANGDPSRFASFGLPVAPDLFEGFVGPLAGLHAGMRWSEANLPEARFIVSVPSDTPFFPPDLVVRLSEGCGRDENTVALAASTNGTHPIFGLWPVKLADPLERLLKSGKAGKMIDFADSFMRLNVPFDDIVLPSGETVDPFFNINTPENAAEAERFVAALEGQMDASPVG
jgi:molybdopterin-guanine dinucleotide biosynthesis protein A